MRAPPHAHKLSLALSLIFSPPPLLPPQHLPLSLSTPLPPLTQPGFRIDGEFEIVGDGMVTIALEPNSMVSEQVLCLCVCMIVGDGMVRRRIHVFM
jgi:hypothetical protein